MQKSQAKGTGEFLYLTLNRSMSWQNIYTKCSFLKKVNLLKKIIIIDSLSREIETLKFIISLIIFIFLKFEKRIYPK